MKRYIKVIFFVILVIGFFISVRYNESIFNSSLKKNGKIAVATIVAVESGNKAKYLVVEFISESGEKIRYNEIFGLNNSKNFLNKKFTIIYNPDRLMDHILLYRRVHFESMDIPFPDSLKWVDQYEGLFNL